MEERIKESVAPLLTAHRIQIADSACASTWRRGSSHESGCQDLSGWAGRWGRKPAGRAVLLIRRASKSEANTTPGFVPVKQLAGFSGGLPDSAGTVGWTGWGKAVK